MPAHPRLACLRVPLFPLAARLRCEPELIDEALAVLEGEGDRARIVAATRTVRRAGIRPGMTLPQARALMPKLVARSRDPESERAAQESLLEVAESFSPRIEDGGEGIAYIDLEGMERHFATAAEAGSASAGDDDNGTGDPGIDSPRAPAERAAGEAMIAAARAAGLPVWVGIAGSKLAARIAAEEGGSPTVVPPREEARFLAPLPLHRLAPEVRVATTLARWGIRSVGELARLSPAEVASRLGAAGRELHATARGLDPRPLTPREPPPVFREGMDLEWPLVALEPFLFVARAALERLCRRLEATGLGCLRLELGLRLEPDGHDERAITLPAPSRDPKTLLTLVRLDLEGRPPGAPVAGFAFTAHPDEPRTAQLSLLGPEALAPDRLAATVARLFALLGPGRVGSPRPVDGHRPESFALVPYAPPPPPTTRCEPRRGLGLLTVRVLRPRVAVEVLVAGSGAGGAAADEVAEPEPIYGEAGGRDPHLARLRLLSVRSLDPGRGPRIEGRVRVASGPWRMEEGWWAENPVERDYWDVELAGGSLYRLFRDRRDGEWYVDGIYD